MAGRAANPASPATGAMRLLGVASYAVAGEYDVVPPAGTRMVRMELRGGGGAGAGQSGTTGGGGGGEGALQRRLVRVRGGGFRLTIGAGGTNAGGLGNRSGGASSALGYVAAGGQAGSLGSANTVGGGLGTDDVEVRAAHGSFHGRNSDGVNGGGLYGGRVFGPFFDGRFGGGGAGTNPRPEASSGWAGGDGYADLEFYG